MVRSQAAYTYPIYGLYQAHSGHLQYGSLGKNAIRIAVKNEAMKDMLQEMFNPLVKLNPFDKTGTKAAVPTGVAQFQTDLLPPKAFAEKFFDIRQWNKLPKGGHFAAMEQPELLAEDIRQFVGGLSLVK